MGVFWKYWYFCRAEQDGAEITHNKPERDWKCYLMDRFEHDFCLLSARKIHWMMFRFKLWLNHIQHLLWSGDFLVLGITDGEGNLTQGQSFYFHGTLFRKNIWYSFTFWLDTQIYAFYQRGWIRQRDYATRMFCWLLTELTIFQFRSLLLEKSLLKGKLGMFAIFFMFNTNLDCWKVLSLKT